MSKKISENVRDELLRMHSSERSDLKCVLTKRLYGEAKKSVKSIEKKIDIAEQEVVCAKEACEKLKDSRDDMLKGKKLYGVVYEHNNRHNSCELEETHPDIISFNAESAKLRKEILLL